MLNLREEVQKKGILLAAHRGVNGGNIPCNSMACYLAASRLGADIIEMDVAACKGEEELFMLHPGMEAVHTTIDDGRSLSDLTRAEVEKHFLKNQDLVPTQYPLVTLNETLDALKGKCFINIDKFWDHPLAISKAIKEKNMTDQVVIKSNPNQEKIMKIIEEYASDIPFISIINDPEKTCHEELKKRNINYVGAEVLFGTDDHYFLSEEFIDGMHQENLVVWANTIVFNYKANISASFTDDQALLKGPDAVWGVLARKGIDIIQTDWLTPCLDFLAKAGYKK